jgi:hypothetical protein
MSKKIIFCSLALFISCQTVPPAPVPVATPKPFTEPINISEVKSRLNMNRSVRELGFREQRFNRCDYVQDEQCRDNYVVLVHFRLLCRESEGTVDTVASSDLIPIRSEGVAFKLGNTIGRTETDADGYGQVEVIRPKSALRERLRLTIDERFVAVPAIETSRIVVPENWCNH